MKIKKLYLKRFGRFTDKTIELDDGINVIYGLNESGKSTVSFFIRAMLFGLDEKLITGGTYEKYFPWTDVENFGGSMDFEIDNVNYRISRCFYEPNRSVKIVNSDNNRELVPAERVLSELFAGLDEADYINSFFCFEGAEKPGREMVAKLKKHTAVKKDMHSAEVDTDYALRVLSDRRNGLSDNELMGQIRKIDEVIEREEKTERKLDEIAAMEQEGRREIKELKARTEKFLQPSLFEKKETEYYRYKERYKTYKKDLELSGELSEQLDNTILVREELEKNSEKLERCKEELAAVRIFKKKNQDGAARTRQEIESAGRLLLTESKSNLYIQTVFLVFAAILVVAGFVMRLESVTAFYTVLLFLSALACAVLFVVWTVKWHVKKKENKDELMKLREALEDYKSEYELFFRAHSSEEELAERLEEYLKEDGRIPAIIEKESELSGKLERLNSDIEQRDAELLEFFSQFGSVEDLKDDELVVQEESLKNAKENRIKEVSEVEARISELNESLIKMQMQVQAGEENESSLRAHKDERAELLEKHKECEKKLKAIELAMKMIEELSDDGKESFCKVINQKASRYAAAFTGNQYTSFITDEKLGCRVDYYDRYVPVENLSNGAEEQMNLVLRMSIGDVILKDYELPLIFDDAFVYYDDARLAGTLKEISKRSEQIIVFTCQSREETILDQLNLEYKLVNL